VTKERYGFAVIGAGIMGAATVAALAARGHSVVLLEQFTLGHDRGSSHGRSRIFRFSYPEVEYVDMAREALGLWRDAEERSGEKLLDITGGLDIGDGIERNAQALEAAGADFTLATGRELRSRYPYLRFDNDAPVLFSPDSGTIAAERSISTFVALARADGADVFEERQVTAIDERDDDVVLRTDEGDIIARVVIVTAGAWAKGLLAPIEIELPVWVTRETVAYFELDEKPPTLVDWGSPLVYSLPSPGQGLKAAQHIAGPRTHPEDTGRPDTSSVAIVAEWVREHFPSANAEPSFAETCLYTNTDDERFILERHGNVVVGSPCSGHGFKFAPLIGKRLADLALEH
jgi:monomeric sarcosine oxidase